MSLSPDCVGEGYNAFGLSISPPAPPRSSKQILLPRYLMNGLSNFTKIYREYSIATTDDLIRFWRSKVAAGRQCGEGIQSTSTLGRQSSSCSLYFVYWKLIMLLIPGRVWSLTVDCSDLAVWLKQLLWDVDKRHFVLIFITSPAAAVAKYCDVHACMSVSLSVFLSARISAEPSHARSLPNLFVHVAYGHSWVLLRQGDEISRKMDNFGGFLPQFTMHCTA